MPVWLVAVAAVLLMMLVGVGAVIRAQRPGTPGEYVPQDLPAPAPNLPLVVFIGDSYVAGAGATARNSRWTTLAARELGWEEVNRGRGGTGYVAASGLAGCGRDYCPSFPEMLAAPFDRTPDIVVISGGRNDPTELDEFRAGVEATLVKVRTIWPDAELVVTNPLWDDDLTPPSMTAKQTIVLEVAAAHGVLVLDLGQPLQDRPDLVASDGVQPNDAGHRTIASAFVAAWRTTHPTPVVTVEAPTEPTSAG